MEEFSHDGASQDIVELRYNHYLAKRRNKLMALSKALKGSSCKFHLREYRGVSIQGKECQEECEQRNNEPQSPEKGRLDHGTTLHQ